MNNHPRHQHASFYRCTFFLLPFLLSLTYSFPLFCQTTSISGIVNRYTAVSAIDTCSGRLSVGDTTGFKAGAPVLLIQMQGAEITSTNNFLYGIVQSMNFAGRYERSVIDSVGPNALFVQKRLVNTFSPAGKLQVVRIAQYADAVVTDTLKCQPWNGSTGGVLALEVTGTLTLNAPVLADGAGFRGGSAYTGGGNNCNFLIPEVGYYYALPNWRGAYKGEGIALPLAGKELGRGPQANGGGGGNDHNSGGGGGGNITDGGDGGDNDEPSVLGCDGYYPGVRGYGIFFTTGRLFMGGGGGAGHANNNPGGAGASGGGIILIEAADINGTVPVISANGASASFSNGDGAGGGGAGGTIRLKADSAPPGMIVRANGGIGGNTINNNANRCFGPGGGGAGGRILTNLFGITSPSGGLAGVVTGSSNACNGTPNGAGKGDAGLVEPLPAMPQGTINYLIPQIVGAPLPDTVCPGESAVFLVLANAGDWNFQWQMNTGTGWQDITGGAQFAGFQNDTLVISNVAAGQNGHQFRCRVSRTGCYEITSPGAGLAVAAAPTAGFTTTVNGYVLDCNNQSNATSYYWNFGDGATSQAVSPQHTYALEGTYTITLLAITECDTAIAVKIVTILLPPVAGFTFTSPVEGCGAVQVPFSNTSSPNATEFFWTFPGGNPANSSQPNPTVSYSTTGVYFATLTASNAAGQGISMQIVAVTVNPLPVADFSFFVQPDGTVQFADQSQNAANLLWDFGDNTSSSLTDPQHIYDTDGNYVTTLTVWNDCDTVSVQKTIPALFPPTAGFFVQDTTYGCFESVVDFDNTSSLNAASYAWNFPGGVPATSNALHPSVTYSVSGAYTAQLIVSNNIGADTLEQSFAVQILGFPVADFNYAIFPGGVVQFTNLSQEALSYTWDFGDGYPQVSGSNIYHDYAASGTYTVTLIASNPCGVSILQQVIEVNASGVAAGEPQGLGRVRVFPNPASERLTIDCSESTAQAVEIQVFDAGGNLVYEQDFPKMATNVAEILLGDLAAGTYQVAVKFEKGKLVRTMIKSH